MVGTAAAATTAGTGLGPAIGAAGGIGERRAAEAAVVAFAEDMRVTVKFPDRMLVRVFCFFLMAFSSMVQRQHTPACQTMVLRKHFV